MRLALPTLLFSLSMIVSAAAAEPMPLCGKGPRADCVVDGDTIWIGREKIRLAGIDAPEGDGRCAAERELAARAMLRLAELMSEATGVERLGLDRYGRTLAIILTTAGSVNDALVSERLARPWEGSRKSWCGAQASS